MLQNRKKPSRKRSVGNEYQSLKEQVSRKFLRRDDVIPSFDTSSRDHQYRTLHFFQCLKGLNFVFLLATSSSHIDLKTKSRRPCLIQAMRMWSTLSNIQYTICIQRSFCMLNYGDIATKYSLICFSQGPLSESSKQSCKHKIRKLEPPFFLKVLVKDPGI